jgi:toxin ParE1/3/4
MTRILRRPRAEQDLGEIFDWIADDSPANADAYIERLVATMRLLAGMPHMGSCRLPRFPSVRSFPVGSHLIFYQPIGDGIEIIRVIHGARDWENDEEIFS